MPGLVLTRRKTPKHHLSASPQGERDYLLEGLKLLYLKPTAARFHLAGIFMAELNLMLAAVPSHDKQLTIALISGLKLTDLFVLGLWNKRGQNNIPQSRESPGWICTKAE